MPDKQLIKNRFLKSLKSYNKNALVQDVMADKLLVRLEELCGTTFGEVFEFGTGTACYSGKLASKISFKRYLGNDIIANCASLLKSIIPSATFVCGDVEEIDLPGKFDLITANAVFQWIENPEKLLDKFYASINDDGIVALTSFGANNCREIADILRISLKYYKLEELREFCKYKFDVLFLQDEVIKLAFDTPYDVLRHLKYTGTNAVSEKRFTKSDLKLFCDKYNMLYSNGSQVELTYHSIYMILKKRK